MAILGQFFHLSLQVLLAETNQLTLGLSHSRSRSFGHVDQCNITKDAALSQYFPHSSALSLQLNAHGTLRNDKGKVRLIIDSEDMRVSFDLKAFH